MIWPPAWPVITIFVAWFQSCTLLLAANKRASATASKTLPYSAPAATSAFRSTLTEVQEATLIVHVVDGSDEDPFGQISAVREVLNEIGAGDIPELIAINKSDIADPLDITSIQGSFPDSIVISAATSAGLEDLLNRIDGALPQNLISINVTIPYSRGDLISRIHESGEHISICHVEAGSDVSALVPPALAAEIESQGFLRAG